MRVVVAYEGIAKVPGQFLMRNSLWWDEERPLPIVMEGDYSRPLGFGTDLRREEDYSITAEIPDEIIPAGYSTTVYCDKVEHVGKEGLVVAKTARIRGLYFTHGVPW